MAMAMVVTTAMIPLMAARAKMMDLGQNLKMIRTLELPRKRTKLGLPRKRTNQRVCPKVRLKVEMKELDWALQP